MRCTATLAVLGLLALVSGCATGPATVRPYASMPDVDQARRQAGLVVEGEVVRTENTEPLPLADEGPSAFPFGHTANKVAYRTRVTAKVKKVLKGAAAPDSTVDFWFISPSDHADATVLLDSSLPAVMDGDRLRVFLENRGGQWWLVAHERWYRDAAFQPYVVRGPVRNPSARFIMIEGTPATGAEAGVVPGAAAGTTPATGAPATGATAPSQPAAPATPATPRQRFPARTRPDRSWPPPRQPAAE